MTEGPCLSFGLFYLTSLLRKVFYGTLKSLGLINPRVLTLLLPNKFTSIETIPVNRTSFFFEEIKVLLSARSSSHPSIN